MNKTKRIIGLTLAAAIAAALAILPVQSMAQTTNHPATTKKTTTEKKEATTRKTSGYPFHGKLAAIDKAAKTITIGKSTYQITSETKLKKGDKPATLDDAVVGENISGYAKSGEGDKKVAGSVNFAPKSEGKSTTTSKKTTEKPK